MMSLFKAVTTKHGLWGGEFAGLQKKECKYVCLVVSRRGKSFEKLGRREITSFGVFEIFLGSTFLVFPS